MDEPIRSVTNPLIKSIRKLADNRSERNRTGRFLLEGYKPVLEAIRRRGSVELVLLSVAGNEMDNALVVDAAGQAGVSIRWISEPVAKAISDAQTPQGVIAVCHRPPAFEFEPDPSGPLFMIDHIQDPGNVGALIRVAAAMGHLGILVSGGSADPFSAKATRASAGLVLSLPIATDVDIAEVAERCHEAGGAVLLAEAGSEHPVWSVGQMCNSIVVFGSEGQGPSETARKYADGYITVPMVAAVESLNVAVAAGMIGYEAFRAKMVGTLK